MLIEVPVPLIGASCLQIAFAFRAAVNDSVLGGPLSVFPLFHLFAEFSQIDDFAHLGPLPCLAPVGNSDKSTTPLMPYPVMAANEVHHVGDIIAMAVADGVTVDGSGNVVISDLGNRLIGMPAWQGALATVYAATMDLAEGMSSAESAVCTMTSAALATQGYDMEVFSRARPLAVLLGSGRGAGDQAGPHPRGGRALRRQ